jgi:hypothetical protein
VNPLHLFPTAGFDRSTTTPVLLGVLISWFFTETFGWVFAGLVVPGYLAAVFAIDPRAGMVDVAEAIFTYGLARGIGEHLTRTGLTSRVFGRERFLLIVLCSIIVRLAVEGAILPRFAPHAAGSFFSIGLVVVPLAANACWKTGLGRGLIQTGVPTVIVFLLLRFVLIPYTNLSLAGFELATEDVAASFLASPKAYILLITGAILAAAANVLDGWDFNGILIPALLSLVVIEPVKFGATFVEALVIVAVATAILKTTRLGRANVEGPRRLVLFFSIDYAMRFAFAGLVGKGLPGADVVGLMGFGYLLPTLLAVKIAQRGNAPLVLLPTAQVSVGAFALGTLIGFSAAMVDTAPSAARTSVARPLGKSPHDPESAGLWLAALSRSTAHDGKGPVPMSGADLAKLADRALAEQDLAKIDNTGHLDLQRLDRGVLLLREKFQSLEDRWGDPSILVTSSGRASGRRVILVVDTPVTAPETAALAARLVAEGRADAAVIAGIESELPTVFGKSTLETARALAARDNDAGVVIALRRSADGNGRVTLGSESLAAARIDSMIMSLEGSAGALPRKTGALTPSLDATIELPESAIAQLFPIDNKPIAISSPAAMATTLDDIRTSTAPTSVEDLLALRRLVLDPLLGPPGTKRSIPLMRMSAAKLGYALLGPSQLASGGEGFVLMPVQPRPIAAVVKTNGVAGTVVEVPHGYQDGLRDVAVRMSNQIGADAILFGLEHGGAARGSGALRLAHAIASAAVPGRTPRVVVLRSAAEGENQTASVALGTWGGSARDELSASVKKAFTTMGLTTNDMGMDLAVRELSGRAVFGDTPIVAATIDPLAIRAVSLDEARGGAKVLASSGMTTYDGALVDIAHKLASGIPADATAPTVDIIDLARRSTIEQSVVARRSLDQATSHSAARSGLVRAKNGDFVLVVARDGKGFLASATSTDPRAKLNEQPLTTVKSLKDCAAVLDASGSCRAEAL